MKKFYFLAAAILCALTVSAGNYESLGEINRESFTQVKPATLEKVAAPLTVSKAMALADNAPASIIGKTYVTTYSDGYVKCNNYIDVTEGTNDSIVLGGFAGGYDVSATYDASTGTITIPTGYVIANHSTYGPITMYALNAAEGTISDGNIIGKIEGNTITFDLGVYCTIVQNGTTYYITWMQDIMASEANGMVTVTLGGNKYGAPIIATKTADNTINIVGISTILFGNYYSVPVIFDATTNTATISYQQPIDLYPTSDTQSDPLCLYPLDGGYITTSDPVFSVKATDNSTAISATGGLLLGYKKASGSYSGYQFTTFDISVDYNIYTAAVDGSNAFDPNPVINNINYTLDPETKTAEVTGCLAGITSISIPSTITMQGVDYTVISVGEAAFQANRNITTLSLPASLKTVGYDAFRNVTNLRTLYIEDLAAWCGVVFTNGNANPIYNVFPTAERNWGKVYFNNTLFEGELTIPAGVKSINRSFYGLKSLTKVNLPEGLDTIGDQAFANAIKLTEVTIPSSVTGIGSAFFSCSALETVNLPEGLITMGNNMFYSCKALTSITIPASVKNIGSSTFLSCSNIETVKSLSVVPPVCVNDYTFDDCSTATLLVPAGSVDAYKEATGWKIFTNIEAIITTGIDSIEADENAPVEYYNLQGLRVANPKNGVYIMRQGSKVNKVYVK